MIQRSVNLSAWVMAAAMLAGCGGRSASQAERADATAFRPHAVEAHIRYLADDLLEGREAGTRGYDLAARYVAAQFRQMGLRPAGADATYYQQVPLQAHWLVRDGTRMIVRPAAGPARMLELGEEYLLASSPVQESVSVNAPAVFVGYGIEAPAFTHDDYAGLDVAGKVVVYLAGYPPSWPSEEGAHYGSTREKQRSAAARGAIATLVIYTNAYENVYPWDRYRATVDSMAMTWIAPDGAPFVAAPDIRLHGVVGPAHAAVLFDGAPRSYADVREEAQAGAPKGFPLAVTLDIALRSRHERRPSANVAGMLEGADAQLKNEYVVVLGHLDHEGIARPVDGDAIYNGAMDNAAGMAALLEAAHVLARPQERPRRSVLFLAVTAEEKGLLGSEYFARHPTVPRGSMVAAVNLDMPLLLHDFTDVIAYGAEHSTLKGAVESALKEAGLTLTPDPAPEQVIFTRSDHYRFVQQGIPSVYLTTGVQGDGARVAQEFLARHYHQPSDDLRQPINYAAGARFARVNYLIIRAVADDPNRPAWNEGDFFGDLYGRER